MNRKIFLFMMVFLFLFTVVYIFSEVIILENGKIINGKIIKMDEDTMTIITGKGEFIIDRDQINQIYKDEKTYKNKIKNEENINSKFNINNNLIAYYPFNGNANDESTNNYNGQVIDAQLTNDRFNNKDSAYFFNGKNSIIKTDLDINPRKYPVVTLSVWVYPQKYKIPNSRRRFQILSVDQKDFERTLLIMNNTWMVFIGKGNNYWNSGIKVEYETWTHAAVVFDFDKVRLYINGKGYYCNKKVNVINSSNTLVIGNFHLGTAQAFYGTIDDIRIYDKALSEEDINNIYKIERVR